MTVPLHSRLALIPGPSPNAVGEGRGREGSLRLRYGATVCARLRTACTVWPSFRPDSISV
jgi:hypothetical protein